MGHARHARTAPRLRCSSTTAPRPRNTPATHPATYRSRAASRRTHHFNGKQRDAESGNDDFRARYYASTMGRWLTPDWASGAEAVPYASYGSPQSLNLYAYVGNNPLSSVDPDGHQASRVVCSNGQNGGQCGVGTDPFNDGIFTSGGMTYYSPISGQGNKQEQSYNSWLNNAYAQQGGAGFWGRLGRHLDNLLHLRGWNNNGATVTTTQIDLGGIIGGKLLAPMANPGSRAIADAAKWMNTGGRPVGTPAPNVLDVGRPLPGTPTSMTDLSPPTKLSKAVDALGKVLKPYAKIGSGASRDLNVIVCFTCRLYQQEMQLEYGPPPRA